jgi:hypothetical protein
MAINMNPMPLKIIKKKLVYGLEVFMGCQRILDPKGTQRFQRKKSQKK